MDDEVRVGHVRRLVCGICYGSPSNDLAEILFYNLLAFFTGHKMVDRQLVPHTFSNL